MNHIEKLEKALILDLGQEDKLQLDFNESHTDYVKVSQYIQDKDLSWVSEKSRQAAIQNEKMWKLKINEHAIHAHTLTELLIEKLSHHFDSLSEVAELSDLLSLLENILLEKLTGQNSTIYISYSYILDREEYEMSMKESKIVTDKTEGFVWDIVIYPETPNDSYAVSGLTLRESLNNIGLSSHLNYYLMDKELSEKADEKNKMKI